mgnify:CR=1 FL=1
MVKLLAWQQEASGRLTASTLTMCSMLSNDVSEILCPKNLEGGASGAAGSCRGDASTPATPADAAAAADAPADDSPTDDVV